MMHWYGTSWGAGGWVLMLASMTFFWGLVVLAGVAIFRGTGGRDAHPAQRDTRALDLLDERFARGEIDAEEYEARTSVLETRTS